MANRIYTKTGDKGQTSLIGGTRVPKHHIRIEAYGTVDELNSWVGLLRDEVNNDATKKLLIEIQDRLFTIGSLLAADPEKSKMKLPELSMADITLLEKEIDAIDAVVPPMKSFVLPGGNVVVSHTHIARCVCRRAERNVTHLAENFPVNEMIVQYLNRLSDYLFMLSRKLSHDLGAEEIPWVPRS
ncbi:MAG TPA: cob(I)yrinic acid a,c-diamide adenosyltransferase [Bacteroidia bacterium]|jgi:cob(I)alamin adenosyltransferase|nr:cob(I)yrinic acid a,c-diamide adenosyltransferase [Bacteroidia bacterium]